MCGSVTAALCTNTYLEEQEQIESHEFIRNNKCRNISATCSVHTPESLDEEPLSLQSQSEIGNSETIYQQNGHQLDGQSELDPSIATVYKCANCSFRCWLCNTAKIARKPPAEDDNMNQMPPPSTPTTSWSKRRRNDGLQYLGPKDRNFERFILAPANIFISRGILPSKPEDISKDNVPDETTKNSQVFLKFDHSKAVEISTQILHSHQRSYDEIALMKVVAKYLAPFDPYISMDGPEKVVSLCRDKWQPGIKGPSVPTALGLTYDWDIVPDMSYMVALNVLPTTLRYAIIGWDMEWLCADAFGVGPYLTLEFKSSEGSGKDSDAVRQVTVASVIWLHQRKRMKEALKSSDTEDLQHYSIVLNSVTFQVWRTTLEGTKYMTRMLDHALLSSPSGIELYIKWWNAIHRW
ncbi:hypothetical protein MMC06_004157, partial [Schaereria dolodes]|nr:hypothetical protein [Schaereria dolodes]